MIWITLAVVVAVVVLVVLALLRRGRNSGTPGARDAARAHGTDLDAYAARTQHQGNIYGAGGGGLPF
jgi:hypothetical protein